MPVGTCPQVSGRKGEETQQQDQLVTTTHLRNLGRRNRQQAGGRAESVRGRGGVLLKGLSRSPASTDPTLPQVWAVPPYSHLIQVSARAALNRHSTGGAGGKLLSPCSRESLLHLREKSTQNLETCRSPNSARHNPPWQWDGSEQPDQAPRPFTWLISFTTAPRLPSSRAIFFTGINILPSFSTWQAPTHPPIPRSNSTSSVRPSLLIPWG